MRFLGVLKDYISQKQDYAILVGYIRSGFRARDKKLAGRDISVLKGRWVWMVPTTPAHLFHNLNHSIAVLMFSLFVCTCALFNKSKS